MVSPAQMKSLRRMHPNTILMFRMDGRLHTFGEDAVTLVALMGGDSVPVGDAEEVIAVLIEQGHRVAVCDESSCPPLFTAAWETLDPADLAELEF